VVCGQGRVERVGRVDTARRHSPSTLTDNSMDVRGREGASGWSRIAPIPNPSPHLYEEHPKMREGLLTTEYTEGTEFSPRGAEQAYLVSRWLRRYIVDGTVRV